MDKLILGAIPFFLLTVVIEAFALRHAAKENREDAPVGYKLRDSATSMTMGVGHLVIGGVWKVIATAIFAAIFIVSPFQLPDSAWWTWVLLFFADDFSYYWYHRLHHRVRIFWATHVVHHSSEHYNLSTALRQDWSPFTATLFWLWEALFFSPWMIGVAIAWNLLFQFTLHTEAVNKYPRPIEWIFNTPSHHRVHHGSQEQYLDRNYAGILIIWDRIFGTFEPEGERVRYGLTTNITTFNPVRVAYGEFAAIWRDVKGARSLRERIAYAVRPPGWAPDNETERASSAPRAFAPTGAGARPGA